MRSTLSGALASLAAAWILPGGTHAAEAPGRSIEVEAGQLYYESCGAGPTAVVLMHDGVADSAVFDDVWPLLCRDFHVIRYDRRGYGRSPQPKGAYTPADDIAAVMKDAKVERVALVGSSAGGGIAVDFALQRPQQVSALVLVGAQIGGLPISDHFILRNLRLQQAVAKKDIGEAIKDPYIIAPGHDAARQRLRAILAANPHDLAHRDYPRTPKPAMTRLSEVHAPTLVLVGEADIADVHAQAGALEYALPRARRVVMPEAGHLMYLEQPQAFADQVSRFLRLSGF